MDIGRVRSVEDKFAYVNMEMHSACKSCGSKGFCFAGDKPILLKVINTLNAKVGDRVEIDVSSGVKLGSGFILFIIPVIFLIAGYAFGMYITESENETGGIVGAVSGLILSFILQFILNRIFGKVDSFSPVMVKIIPK